VSARRIRWSVDNEKDDRWQARLGDVWLVVWAKPSGGHRWELFDFDVNPDVPAVEGDAADRTTAKRLAEKAYAGRGVKP
jgi:hypothetical protein